MTQDDDMGDLAAALARAEAAVKALARDYLGWAQADLAQCRQHLAAATVAPDNCTAPIADLFGIAHNIKGQGASFNYPLMTQLGDSLCLLTRDSQHFNPASLPLVAAHLDLMDEILTGEISGPGDDAIQARTQQLREAVSAIVGGD